MKNSILATCGLALLTLSSSATTKVSIDEGKAIFTTRCTSCHNVNKQIVGPALANVDKRRTIEWIISFIHSPKTLIMKNDQDAVNLFNQFNQVTMPDHQDLSTDNIKSIVEYIKAESSVAVVDKAPFAKPGKLQPAYTPLSINDYGFFTAYLSLVLLLVASLVFAVHVKELQRNKQA